MLRFACYGPNDHKITFHEGTSIGVLESAFQSQKDELCLHLLSFRSRQFGEALQKLNVQLS